MPLQRSFWVTFGPKGAKMELSGGGADMRLDHAWQCLVKVDRFRKKSPPRRLREAILAIWEPFWLPFGLHFGSICPPFCPPILHAVFQCHFGAVGARIGGPGGRSRAKLRALAGLWGVVSYASSHGKARWIQRRTAPNRHRALGAIRLQRPAFLFLQAGFKNYARF